MYPRTPIRITPYGEVLAWVWNGREYQDSSRGPYKIPVYRLGKPSWGKSRNGRVLRIPSRGDYVTVGEAGR